VRVLTRAPWPLLLALPCAAQAHPEAGATPGWTFDPWLVAPLLLAAVSFTLGTARLRQRSRHAPGTARVAAFTAGWGVLAAALLSPLHAAGERSFAAHMLEHELLMLVAAPLLVLGHPLGVFAWSLPAPLRRRCGGLQRQAVVAAAWRLFTRPLPATLLQAMALWLWHAPGPFQLALAHPAWHAAQHLCFLVTALGFWTAMLDRRARTQPMLVAGCLFATSLVGGALGALMAFSWSAWYPLYANLGMTPLGLDPVGDQQLAGLLMWIPGGLVHVGVALAILARLLRDADAHPLTGPHAVAAARQNRA